MQTTKWDKFSQCGYALVLAAGLLIPGISQAAVVTGETTTATPAGDITVEVEVDGMDTVISIIWPENRWVGISFGTDGTAHDNGYMIISSLDGKDVYEANAAPKKAPVRQDNQDLTIDSFVTGGGTSELVLSRFSDTGDSLDFLFQDVAQTIALQWALGVPGQSPAFKHDLKGVFMDDLVLAEVPVPAALPLLASGLFALGLFARRKKAA